MDLKSQVGFWVATAGGLVVSVLTSDKHSWSISAARVAAGLFCSVFLTEPFLHHMALDPDTYALSVSGLFAMTGYAMTRFIANANLQTVLDIIKIIRGGK